MPLNPRDGRVDEPKGNNILQPVDQQETLRRHYKIAVHHVRHADVGDGGQADGYEAKADVDDGPMELALAAESDHQQPGGDDDGREREKSETCLGLEDAVVAARLAGSPFVGRDSTDYGADEVANYAELSFMVSRASGNRLTKTWNVD